ncbi:MAG TPA: zf-HC2 domain-containing protein, partial [Ktedonobacterales bacterium]|nr:zf-HC2 domain-containing protein [Ktedonobacterales bacterium]
MNTFNMRHPSGPECARYAELLPQFRQGTLTHAEEMSLRAHLATCGYCQAQLADYDRLDAALYTYIGRFARTAPAADDLVRLAVTRVPSTSPAQLNHHQSQASWESRRDYSMYNDPDETTYEVSTLPRYDRRPPQTQNSRTRPVLATIAALLLIGLAATLFAVVGRPSTSPAQSSTPTATTLPTATTQPTVTLQPTQNTTVGVVNSGHACSTDTSGRTSYVYIGDLKVSKVDFANAYPANELPANLDQAKPYQLPDNLPNPPNPAVNPEPWYDLTVCNTSNTTSHVIRGLTARIAAFTPYSGTLNSYMFCDQYYQRPNGVSGGGCGGGLAADEWLRADFAANATAGAQVTATQDGSNIGNAPPLPVSLGPGQMLFMALRMTPPTALGTYTFAFGLNYDSVTSAHISTMLPTIFDSAA